MKFKSSDVIDNYAMTRGIADALAKAAGVHSWILFDDQERVVGCNPEARELTGHGDALLTKSLADLWASESMTLSEHSRKFHQIDESDQPRQMAEGINVPLRRACGEVIQCRLSFAPLRALPSNLGIVRMAILEPVK